LISLTEKKDIHNTPAHHVRTKFDGIRRDVRGCEAGGCVMSFDDSVHWLARAAQMRGFAEETKGGISKHLLRRIAEDYERFARTIEPRPNRFPPAPAVVPTEVRLYGRKNSAGAPPRRFPDLVIPSFLKRGPATADELGASA
jgi:hypothetical protein